MDPNTALPMLLPLAGAILQFTVRQFKSLPDTVFYTIAVVLATWVYVLVSDSSVCPDWQRCQINYLAWMCVHFSSLLGGTAIASNAAKGVAKANPMMAARSPFIPLTDSK